MSSAKDLNAAVTVAIMRAEGMDHEHAALWEAVAHAEEALLACPELSLFEHAIARDGHCRAIVKAGALRRHLAIEGIALEQLKRICQRYSPPNITRDRVGKPIAASHGVITIAVASGDTEETALASATAAVRCLFGAAK
jgi:hypothetical protein